MVCAAVLIIKDFGAKNALRLDIAGVKPAVAQEILAKSYDIADGDSAIAVLERFSRADAQNLVISEVFEHIIAQNKYEIARSIFAPIKQEHIADLNLPTNFPNFWKSVTNNANADLDTFMKFLRNPESAEQSSTFHNITLSAVVGRLNKHIKGYETTMRALSVFGYTADELMNINSFEAWDLGRCCYLARLAAHCGFITEEQAWQFIETSGTATYKTYVDWRQFLAAHFLGRGMTHSADDIVDYNETLAYVLRDKKSPLKLYPLKNA